MPVLLPRVTGDAKEKTNGTYPVILSQKYWCLEAGVIGLRGLVPKTYAFSTTKFLSVLGGVFNLKFCHSKYRVEPNAPVYLSTR